jgi:major vault protein
MSRRTGPTKAAPTWDDLPIDKSSTVIRLPPSYFVQILNTNTHTTEVIVGPATVTRGDHESIVSAPRHTIVIPPGYYCVVADPVKRDADDKPLRDAKGQWQLRFGDQEVRETQEPFPLCPGESIAVPVTPLPVIAKDAAYRLRAVRDFVDRVTGKERKAGEEWLVEGPLTYIPVVEAQIIDANIRAQLIAPGQALKLRARVDTEDRNGGKHKAGEVWLVRAPGFYLAGVDEIVEGTVNSYILTENQALHLRATRTFEDVYGRQRHAGAEWLVTKRESSMHLPDVYEEFVRLENAVVLNNRQYCVVLDPVDEHQRPQLGKRVQVHGPKVFFLQPGERLQSGTQDVFVLGEQESLLLKATEKFEDERAGKTRVAGDRWLVTGPTDYFPPVEVEILDRRQRIPLDENEGVYVRDTRSGAVRAVIGESYLLKENEELWAKDVPQAVVDLLGEERRDPTRVIAYRVPHNAAVQIYDYRRKHARVVFGPELVMLEPDEQFTQLSLSGGKPKRPAAIRSLLLYLGPDFSTDILTVETADHARLELKLSYGWYFDIDKKNEEDAVKLFQVPDFIGDFCKAIASRVRGKVASEPFDRFHKFSASIISEAVFGKKSELRFLNNNLVVNAIDIQSVEPVDQRTRDSLMKSVQMAIEITTNSQEAQAMQEAQKLEQRAVGALEMQKLSDEAEAEKGRKELLRLKGESAAVQTTGQAKAEAKARSEAAGIEGQAAVTMATLRAQASKIESETELCRVTSYQEAELAHQKEVNTLEIARTKALSAVEVLKFSETVAAIGKETIKSIAQAGPEMQAKLLSGLGLQGFLVTDGNSPINLFNTANGLIGGV